MADTDNNSEVQIELHLDHVKIELEKATDEVLKQLSLRVVERTQLNIRQNDQIDTGFMVNSIYPIFEGGDGYIEAKNQATARTHSSKTGRRVDQSGKMAPRQSLPQDASAGVVVGANYTIYQEAANPFLYPAAQAAAREFGGEAEAIYKEVLPDEKGDLHP